MKLWLDDLRPNPIEYTWLKTVDEAKAWLIAYKGEVEGASLDHDLGACDVCMAGRTPEQWLEESNFTRMPHCDHFGTGYTLVCWLEDPANAEYRPLTKPTVHSANPVGRARMRQALDKIYGEVAA